MGVEGESEAIGFGVGPDRAAEDDEYGFPTVFEGITQPDCLGRKDFLPLRRCVFTCRRAVAGQS
jgi:hypothetical protein